MPSESEKKELRAHIMQVLREIEAEFMEGRQGSFTEDEVIDEVMRRFNARKNPHPQ